MAAQIIVGGWLGRLIEALYNTVKYSPAWTYPIKEKGTEIRMNGFAVVNDYSEVNEDAFGRTFQDAEAELFFSRNWEASGRPSDAMCGDYPALILNVFQSQITGDYVLHEAALTILFCNHCEGCPAVIPRESAYHIALEMLHYAVKNCENIIYSTEDRNWHGSIAFKALFGPASASNSSDQRFNVLQYKGGNGAGEYLRDANNAKDCLSLTVGIQIEDCINVNIGKELYSLYKYWQTGATDIDK